MPPFFPCRNSFPPPLKMILQETRLRRATSCTSARNTTTYELSARRPGTSFCAAIISGVRTSGSGWSVMPESFYLASRIPSKAASWSWATADGIISPSSTATLGGESRLLPLLTGPRMAGRLCGSSMANGQRTNMSIPFLLIPSKRSLERTRSMRLALSLNGTITPITPPGESRTEAWN